MKKKTHVKIKGYGQYTINEKGEVLSLKGKVVPHKVDLTGRRVNIKKGKKRTLSQELVRDLVEIAFPSDPKATLSRLLSFLENKRKENTFRLLWKSMDNHIKCKVNFQGTGIRQCHQFDLYTLDDAEAIFEKYHKEWNPMKFGGK